MFISPLIGVLVSIRNKNLLRNPVVYSIIFGFFGLTQMYLEGGDAHTHLEHTYRYYMDMSFYDFTIETFQILVQNPTYNASDIYLHTLKFISGFIFGYPPAIHVLAGLVLGLIVGKTMIMLFGYLPKAGKGFAIAGIFIFYFLVFGYFSLNAIRIGTAMWLFLYASVKYFETRKWKYLLYMGLSTQIHLAYAIIGIPVLVVLFIKDRFKIGVLIIFIISFFFTAAPDSFRQYLPQTKVSEIKAGNIYDADQLNQIRANSSRVKETTNFYASIGPTLFYRVGIVVMLLLAIPFYFKTKDTTIIMILSSMYLIYSFANITDVIPSLQGRLINLSAAYFFPYLVIGRSFVQRIKNHRLNNLHKWSVYLLLTTGSLLFLKHLSGFINDTSVFFIGLPILASVQDLGISIKEFIVSII